MEEKKPCDKIFRILIIFSTEYSGNILEASTHKKNFIKARIYYEEKNIFSIEYLSIIEY